MDALTATHALLRSYAQRWWIAGGWALDLHIDGSPRAHQDVDVAVLREDQGSLQQYLAGWSLHKVINGRRLTWEAGEYLVLPVHEIHAERNAERLEFLLNESAGETWRFRRNTNVSMPLSRLSRCTSAGIPYLCPQVVLLFKAKNPRPVDETDFARALPTLGSDERQWLARALELCHPGHDWLQRLKA